MHCKWLYRRGTKKGQLCNVQIIKQTSGSFGEYCSKHRANLMTQNNKPLSVEKAIEAYKEKQIPVPTSPSTSDSSADEDPGLFASNTNDDIDEPLNVTLESNDSDKENTVPNTIKVPITKPTTDTLMLDDIMDEDSEELEEREKILKKQKQKKIRDKILNKSNNKKEKIVEEQDDDSTSEAELLQDSNIDPVETESEFAERLRRQTALKEFQYNVLKRGYIGLAAGAYSFKGYGVEEAQRMANDPIIETCLRNIAERRCSFLPNPEDRPELYVLGFTAADIFMLPSKNKKQELEQDKNFTIEEEDENDDYSDDEIEEI